MTLIAKPIKNEQLWVVTDGSTKVGNVEAVPGGYQLRLGDRTQKFDSKEHIKDTVSINFQRPLKRKIKPADAPWAQWPIVGKAYNNIYDVRKKIHLYTKAPGSKCYWAAGWFNIRQGDQWTTELCPKFIYIQRYENTGPYTTEQAARAALSDISANIKCLARQ